MEIVDPMKNKTEKPFSLQDDEKSDTKDKI